MNKIELMCCCNKATSYQSLSAVAAAALAVELSKAAAARSALAPSFLPSQVLISFDYSSTCARCRWSGVLPNSARTSIGSGNDSQDEKEARDFPGAFVSGSLGGILF